MENEQQSVKRRRIFILGILTLVILAGLGITGWRVTKANGVAIAQATSTAGSQIQTATVRRGDLALSISGTGNLIASQTADLAFSTSGKVASLNVQVGDSVKQGQVLATLDTIPELDLAIQNQELAVQTAEKTLEDAQSNGEMALSQAQADQAAAQAAYDDAKANLHQKGDARCAPSKTQEYYFAYLYAQKRVEQWEGYLADPNTGYGRDYILQKLRPMRKERDQDYINYTYCQSYTDQEIQDSQANLDLAKATLDQVTQHYQALQSTNGLDLDAIKTDQATLESAKLQLTQAKNNLEGATITAPIDGIVMAVNGSQGQDAGTGTFFTLADLSHPLVQVNIDETDLTNLAVGCSAQVTFDSLPGQVFPGTVTDVLPALASVQGVSTVQADVNLEKQQTTSGQTLPLGLSGSVEITCQQANNVLLIPAQALYESASGPSYVYVLDAQGQPEKRDVVVGIKTVALAEIKSGLNVGDRVIISQVEGR